MKTALYPLISISISLSLLPTTSAWGFTIYDHSTKDCNSGASDSTSYAVYKGSGQGGCIEAGNPDSSASCTWYTEGGWKMGPCTAAMWPRGASLEVDEGTKCQMFTEGAGSGNAKFGNGACQDWINNPGVKGPTCSNGIPDGQGLYIQCQDA